MAAYLISCPSVSSFLIQRVLCHFDLLDKLALLQHVRQATLRELAPLTTTTIKDTSTMAPAPRVTHGAERSKLAVVRLLDATLAEGGIDQQGHDMLYRMIMMTSAIGEQLQLIAQTSGVARASTAETIQRYATSLLQGCEVFGGYFEGRMDCARQVAERLPGNKRGKGEESVVSMEAWKTALRYVTVSSCVAATS